MVLVRSLGRTVLLFAATTAIACSNAEPTGPSSGEGAPVVEPVRITEKSQAPVSGAMEIAALNYVISYEGELGLTDRDDFTVRSVFQGRGQQMHVRLQQVHDGLPVWGSTLVVHADGSEFLGLNGTLSKHLGSMEVAPTITADEALAIGKGDYASHSKDIASTLAYSREATELMIVPGEGRNARTAWRVVFFTELQAGMAPGLWNYFVDAKTGEVFDKYNAIHTLSQASGPGGNMKAPRTWTMELDVEPSGAQFQMNTTRLSTGNMNNGTSGAGTIVVGPLDNIGDAPINDAHGYAEKTLNAYMEWYNHNSIDDNGFKIHSRVHYSSNYENAFWDGAQMTYGDGATTFYPLSGDIDVVGHEISHGFTTFHSNLIYSSQSGGMNEAFSDIMGTVVEFFDEGNTADFDLGRNIFKGNEALRFMCNPPQDGISIGHFSDYQEGMDVHFSSGIANKAFCLSSRRFATGDPNGAATQASVRRVGEAFVEANNSFWTESSTFEQSCDGVMAAANALGFSQEEKDHLTQSWQDVGVFCDGAVEPIECDETLTAESGTLTSPNHPANYPDNFRRTWCIQPASGNPATLTFTAFNTEANFDFVKIRDANGATISNTSGTTAPAPATSTLLAITFTSDGSVVATGFSANWESGGGNNEPPTVAITSPADGATVSGSVSVTADAADSDGNVARVVFSLPDGTTVNDDTAPYSANWDSTTVTDGDYEIGAQAFDNVGASATASVGVTVSNGGNDCIDDVFNSTDVPKSIPDNNSTGVTSTLAVAGTGNVGDLKVSLNITHTWKGDLRVTLTSPSGTSFILHNRTGGSADNVVLNNVDVAAFDGSAAAGTWSLKVQDLAGLDVGTLTSWSLDITGDCGPGGGGYSGSATPNLPTVDNGSACNTLTVTGDGNAADVLLSIAGRHDWRSILRGTLAHNGQTVTAFPIGTFPRNAGNFSFTDRAVTGLTGSAAGTWTLCIIDTDGFGDTGVLNSWSVHD